MEEAEEGVDVPPGGDEEGLPEDEGGRAAEQRVRPVDIGLE
jgi:hypothetical protein